MSVFDLPRLYFGGTAVTRLPTGPRGGLVDLASNTALRGASPGPGQSGRVAPFGVDGPAGEYHEHLAAHGARGEHFSGNGHFLFDARVTGVQRVDGSAVDTADPVVGRAVDLWGHYNPYLGTTVNRARVFDVDPASAWTTTLMGGQFAFGREGRSHDAGYLCVGDVTGFMPPRWHGFTPVRRTLHQFAIEAGEALEWPAGSADSPAVRALRAAAEVREGGGLLVQFTLERRATEGEPATPDAPGWWQLRGTVAPWHPDEPRTHPAGRLLVPHGRTRDARGNPCTVRVSPAGVSFNWPFTEGNRPPDAGREPGVVELRTARSDLRVAVLPDGVPDGPSGGGTVVSVPADSPEAVSRAEQEGLVLVRAAHGTGAATVLLRERETVVLTDEACLVLEHPDAERGDEHAVEVPVRTFLRGRPAPLDTVVVRQYPNPRALPLDPVASAPDARCGDVEVVRLRAGRTAGEKPVTDGTGTAGASCRLATDGRGRGWFTVSGARAGTARLLLAARPEDVPPTDPAAPGSAEACYDHADALDFWPWAGSAAVRVLPDDWALDAVLQQDVTFELLHREVFAYYEQLFPFMRDEVFSLEDRCKVDTYAKLIWQMCDPANKDRTYYMPPTRDLSLPKARLLLKYLRARSAAAAVPPAAVPSPVRGQPRITTRAQLRSALWQAVAVELASSLQYLYAGYSVPTHGTGFEYVRSGVWTPRQLRLACGDGGETLAKGVRDSLFDVAREEMMHFLVVNNILMAMGEPFHVPEIDFGTPGRLPLPLDFALEPLHLGSLQRFIAIERPERLAGGSGGGDGPTPFGSPSELYAGIREGLTRVPDLFMVDRGRGGGEHHLFIGGAVNAVHPDYQLEVDDLSSALFAVDFVTEQGEGGVLDIEKDGSDSHHDTFVRLAELLMTERADGPHGEGTPWQPAYPSLRNPTLDPGHPGRAAVSDPHARQVMRLFNRCYFMMLQLIVQHFGESPDASLRRSKLMNAAIDVMTGMMRPLAEQLMPMESGWRGRTAGPSFELEEPAAYIARPDVARRGFAMRFGHLAAMARECEGVPEHVPELMAWYAERFAQEGGR
ncbi:VioB - polyketide synthase [Streptomyces venezuelae]|uniref:ferritin-like domain-containing protein n=1 Tax=Streptomyces venezuelae TaxID=54571 RepID=UPI00123D4DB2|nr:ferritin-like domain-containing protein [Streptomyces venezuelae]QES16482.1 VioB - polyketide synthase [Streptomyces venezuelae]